MHHWGDGFDFKALDNIGRWIAKDVKNHSGCTLVWKEKYGTLRYEHTFPSPIWEKIAGILDRLPGQQYIGSTYLLPYFAARGQQALKEAVLCAIELHPDFEDEILEDIASDEDLMGKEIHDKYWIS